MLRRILLTFFLLTVVGAASVVKSQTTVAVPGTSNPWLAGMPAGTTASGGDTAPDQSPVLVSLSALPASYLEFTSVTGSVSYDSSAPVDPPDGNTTYPVAHASGAENGEASVTAPANSLIGVFLDDSVPSNNPPSPLDFTQDVDRDYTELHPLLHQVFFIGDGKTSAGILQKVYVPAGATRLFLGTMDGSGWYNNTGSFSLTVKQSAYQGSALSGTITLGDCNDPEQAITFEFRPMPTGTPFKVKQILSKSGPDSGTFNILNIPAGTYDIAIKGYCWLQQLLPGIVVNSNVTGLSATLSNGDINNDNAVDTLDFNILVGNFGNLGDP